MSFIVRFPTGLAVTYNDAHFLKYGSYAHELYTASPDKGGKWIASVPPNTGCVIEAVPACRAEFDALTVPKAAQILADHTAELRRLPTWTLRDLKRALSGFNAKTGEWH